MKRLFLMLLLCMTVSVSFAQDKSYKGDGIDTYLEYSPYVAVLAMKAAGIDGASSWKRLAVNGGLSFVMTAGVTQLLKHTIHERRPDGTDNHSFPSGHSAIVFAGASIMHKEYSKISPWISVAGYGVATFTAIDRVIRHRHEWHDVAAGAAIGILSTELCYWIGDKITGERSRFVVAPTNNGLSMIINF